MDSTSSKENEHEEKVSLYVGNLSLKTLDSEVFRLFQTMGHVRFVKVIRPTNDQFYYKPTCYAYVTFSKEEDATKAIKQLNFYELHGNQIRVMHCNKNNYKNEKANVIVKNLPLDVDDKTLFDTFKIFGRILSAKVSMVNGKSMGYGYIQFAEKSSAKKCIKLGSNTTMAGSSVIVEKYEKKQNTETQFTNIYIKNFPVTMTEEELKKIFEHYGEINSFFMPLKENGEPKGFAFCNFVEPNSAKDAISKLHGANIFDLPDQFYVQKAQSKNEREIDIRSQLARLSIEGKNFKRNLYVTNIPGDATEEEIRSKFVKFGKIISIAVEKDTIKPKEELLFAYVCFSSPEEAQLALENSFDLSIKGKLLHVAPFKSKREREIERENSSYLYNPTMATNSRMNPYYDRKSDILSESRIHDDLYKQLYSIAKDFEEKWPQFKAKTKADFAERISSYFINTKSKNELRNMVELTTVLFDNVKTALKEHNFKEKQ